MSITCAKQDEDLKTLQDRRSVDTLLESLLFLSKYYEREISKESLIYGLPIYNNFMSYDIFCQACERLALIPKIVNRKISNISKLALPIILCLENDRFCVLLDYDTNKDTADVILPGLSAGVSQISLRKIDEEYMGESIIIKPEYNFKNKLQDDIVIDNPKKWFWGTLKRNIFLYKYVIFVSIFINIFILAMPLFTMNVYDRVLPNNAIDTLWAFAIGIFFVFSFDLILKIMRTYFLGIASKRADVVMSNKIFNHLLNIRMDSKPSSSGQFVSRLQSFESIREFFTSATISTLVDLPFILLFVVIIFYIAGPIAYITIFTVLISFTLAFYMQKPLKSVIEKSVKEEQIKQTTLIETVTGLEIIKCIRAQNRMRKHWDNSIAKTVEYSEKAHFLSQVTNYIAGFISSFSNIALVTLGVYLAKDGTITMGAIIGAMILNGRVIAPVAQIVGMIIRFDRTMLSMNNLDEIMQMDIEKKEKNYISRPNLSGNIEFKDVSFTYPNQKFNVIKNVNLKIKEGEKVAILGKIGSGKSTLLKMIMDLHEPSSGSILIDNIDIGQIDPADLRRNIGLVPQEPFLFMGSIKDNITIGEQYATDEEILKVSHISGVDDFLSKHEAGFDLQVGERGDGLSGGERQSVTLARALISNPNILMLDEPSNAMDGQSEKQFISRIKSLIKDKTLIVVTHKTSLLELVDRIIILENGEIIADDCKEMVYKQFAGQ